MSSRIRAPFLAFVATLGLLSALQAQMAEEPPHPSDEPRMISIPDSDNQVLSAGAELSRGEAALTRARNYLDEAADADEKKAEKLRRKSREAYEEAAQHFLAAVQSDDTLIGAYVGLGTAWLATGEADKALQAWGTAQKKSPQDPEILFGLGRTFVTLGRPSEAASVYVALGKEDADRAKELLGLLEAWGKPRAAEGEQQAIQLLAWIEEQD